jgi:hypothetical protein
MTDINRIKKVRRPTLSSLSRSRSAQTRARRRAAFSQVALRLRWRSPRQLDGHLAAPRRRADG